MALLRFACLAALALLAVRSSLAAVADSPAEEGFLYGGPPESPPEAEMEGEPTEVATAPPDEGEETERVDKPSPQRRKVLAVPGGTVVQTCQSTSSSWTADGIPANERFSDGSVMLFDEGRTLSIGEVKEEHLRARFACGEDLVIEWTNEGVLRAELKAEVRAERPGFITLTCEVWSATEAWAVWDVRGGGEGKPSSPEEEEEHASDEDGIRHLKKTLRVREGDATVDSVACVVIDESRQWDLPVFTFPRPPP